MISEYKPLSQKSDPFLFNNGLKKAIDNPLNFDLGSWSKSKIFRFACWVRNLDNEYKTHWLKTTAKIGLAALAVFGMLILSPLGVGIVLLDKFITANKIIAKILESEKYIQNKKLKHLDETKQFVKKLGIETLSKIPVVNKEKIGFIEKINYNNSQFFSTYIFGDKDRQEVEKVFEENKSPFFQSDRSLLSVWVENKTNNKKREVLIMFSNGQSWTFANLSNENSETNTKDFGYRFVENIKSVETLSKIINGTHDKYQLVELKN